MKVARFADRGRFSTLGEVEKGEEYLVWLMRDGWVLGPSAHAPGLFIWLYPM